MVNSAETLQKKHLNCKKTEVLRFVFVFLFSFLFFATCSNSVFAARIADDDKIAIKKALKAVEKSRWQESEKLIAETRNPLAAKLYYWLYFTKYEGDVPFNRVQAFIEQNPDWPWQRTLQIVAEENMPDNLGYQDIIKFFANRDVLTAGGMDRYVKALISTNQKAKAGEILNAWWKKQLLKPDEQAVLLKNYSSYIKRDSHKARFSKQLFSGYYTNARRIAAVLGDGYPELAEARIALAEGNMGVDTAINRVPDHLQRDPGLLYERLRWRRRNNKDYGALEILHNMPDPELIPNPEDWWYERHVLIRRMIERKNFRNAHFLAEAHIQKSGVAFAEAEFMAGWLALRYAEKPWRAFEHFEVLYHGTTTPISRARGAYWAGRASEDLGHPEIATKWYKASAQHGTTFYGQLANEKLDPADRPPAPYTPKVNLAQKEWFLEQETVQIAKLLVDAGMEKEASAFVDVILDNVSKAEEYVLLADFAEDQGLRHDSVKISKEALKQGILITDRAYPTILSFMTNIDIEWALVHALIRQESAFNEKATSSAGAKGLMQLMPATAREVARKNKLRYEMRRLTSDPTYNIRLGSSYLEQMLDRYDGSYPLALAAYNAGPGRVNRWLEEIGDPRKGEIDIVDWSELIPIGETRNYVQRVLEGVYVYRTKMSHLQKIAPPPIHVAMK